MHILIVADGRSPITRNWIRVIQPLGYRISLISTFFCEPIEGAEIAAILPVAFARYAGSQAGSNTSPHSKKGFVSRFRPLLAGIRHLLGPWTIPFYARKFRTIVAKLQPDLIHAMRIPYEGMLASATQKEIPLIISTWGNDFTLHASASLRMQALTQTAMHRATAIMSDTERDIRLAQKWGFDPQKPSLVIVGNGGLDLNRIKKITSSARRASPPQIINPRGMRSYVRSDTFFRAIPLVLEKYPDVQFVCVSMAAQNEALEWVKKLGIEKNVNLLPFLNQEAIWHEYARSLISVSISTHDGTPNTLLEAMAFNCIPVCGDLDSIREWITPDKNGFLIPPDDPVKLAKTIIAILEKEDHYSDFCRINQDIIQRKASMDATRAILSDFYSQIYAKKAK